MDSPKEDEITIQDRWFRLVEVCTISKGERKPSMDVCIVRRNTFTWTLLNLNANRKRGSLFKHPPLGGISSNRNIHYPCQLLENVGIPRLKSKQGNIWDKTQSRKEGAFMQSIWHRAVAEFIMNIDKKCHMCMVGISESIAHRFQDCRVASKAWDFSIDIINIMKEKHGHKGPWRPFDWQHMILGRILHPHLANSLEFGYC